MSDGLKRWQIGIFLLGGLLLLPIFIYIQEGCLLCLFDDDNEIKVINDDVAAEGGVLSPNGEEMLGNGIIYYLESETYSILPSTEQLQIKSRGWDNYNQQFAYQTSDNNCTNVYNLSELENCQFVKTMAETIPAGDYFWHHRDSFFCEVKNQEDSNSDFWGNGPEPNNCRDKWSIWIDDTVNHKNTNANTDFALGFSTYVVDEDSLGIDDRDGVLFFARNYQWEISHNDSTQNGSITLVETNVELKHTESSDFVGVTILSSGFLVTFEEKISFYTFDSDGWTEEKVLYNECYDGEGGGIDTDQVDDKPEGLYFGTAYASKDESRVFVYDNCNDKLLEIDLLEDESMSVENNYFSLLLGIGIVIIFSATTLLLKERVNSTKISNNPRKLVAIIAIIAIISMPGCFSSETTSFHESSINSPDVDVGIQQYSDDYLAVIELSKVVPVETLDFHVWDGSEHYWYTPAVNPSTSASVGTEFNLDRPITCPVDDCNPIISIFFMGDKIYSKQF